MLILALICTPGNAQSRDAADHIGHGWSIRPVATFQDSTPIHAIVSPIYHTEHRKPIEMPIRRRVTLSSPAYQLQAVLTGILYSSSRPKSYADTCFRWSGYKTCEISSGRSNFRPMNATRSEHDDMLVTFISRSSRVSRTLSSLMHEEGCAYSFRQNRLFISLTFSDPVISIEFNTSRIDASHRGLIRAHLFRGDGSKYLMRLEDYLNDSDSPDHVESRLIRFGSRIARIRDGSDEMPGQFLEGVS